MVSFIGCVSLFLAVSAFSQDNSDLKKETYFHNIYKNFNESPTPESNWQNALKTNQNQTYLIQKGDTLWDVSNTFFADPQFWPKIWSLNSSDIFNPHEISPENEIVFIPGNIGEPPQVSVQAKTDSNEAPVDEAQPKAPEKQLSYELPPPKPTSGVANIPESLPPWLVARDKTTKSTFEAIIPKRLFEAPTVAIDYYLADQMPTSIGEVVETEMGLSTAAEYQYVHVKVNVAPSQKSVLVVKDAGLVSDHFSEKAGTLVEVQGMLEILDLINPDENIYRALVTKTIHPVTVGAKVSVSELPTLVAGGSGESTPFPSRVIGGQYTTERKLFSRDNLVFLNAGSLQGASIGQIFPIYRDPLNRNPNSKEVVSPRIIGQVKVVNVSENFSTAVVLNGQDEIQTGDATSPDIKSTKTK